MDGTHEDLRSLLPHADRMCLLDAVQSWDAWNICCVTDSHRQPHHPLRHEGRLAALHLCEYGAQAMAVHGGLLARRDRRGAMTRGLLAALRNVDFSLDRIDDIDGPLTVTASRMIQGASGWLYRFEVLASDRWLARGRVSVIDRPP